MAGPEVIGSIAAVLQLMKYGVKVRSCFAELAKNTRNQSQILDELSKQVDYIINAAQSVALASSQTCKTLPITRRCIDKATALQVLLAGWQPETPGDSTMRKKIIILEAVTWHMKEKKIKSLWKEVNESMEILTFQASCKIIAEEKVNSAASMLCVRGPSSSSCKNQCLSSNVENEACTTATMMLTDSTLPPRFTSFVGRKSFLLELEQKQKAGHRIALVGLGGIGKSQLAIEYAHRFRERSQRAHVLFASASSELHLEQSYSRFAVDAKLTPLEAPCASKCQAVKIFLESDKATEWLMIIDGADDKRTFFGPKEFHKFLPHSVHGLIIFTTRSLQLAVDFGLNLTEIINVTPFTPDDAVDLLQSRLGNAKGDLQSMLELSKLLEDLPLALAQAASFIATSCDSVGHYITLYRENETAKVHLLSKGRSPSDGNDVKPVATTWQISFEHIKQDNEYAAYLLCFAACLDYLKIPISLFPKSESQAQFIDALGILKGHCLITVSPSGDSLNMHSLIHLMTRHWLRTKNQLGKYHQLAFDSIYENFPLSFQGEDMVRGDRYSVHAQTLLCNLLSDRCDKRYARLASRLSRYLRIRGNYKNALEYAQMAVNLSETTCGREDIYTLTTQSDLAVTLWYLGRYEAAVRLTTDVLKSREQILGPDHQDTLASSNNLALILHDRGDYKAAEQVHRQTLNARSKILGPRHDDTIRSLNNLGLSLKELQLYEEAEDAFRQAFTEREKVLGKIDISTLRVMDNLGIVLRLRDKFEKASWYHSQALEGRTLLLGSSHPDTLKSKQNLALVLLSQDRLEEAELMTREVLREYEQILGKAHPTTLYAQSNLATVLRNRGRFWEATSNCKQVLEARKTVLGERHPDTEYSKSQYKTFMELMGKNPEVD